MKNKYILTIYSLASRPIFCFESNESRENVAAEIRELNVKNKENVSFNFYGHSIQSSDYFVFKIETLEDFFASRLAKS